MGKRVLVAVDLHSAPEASITYGIELAARIKAPLSLIAISSSRPQGKSAARLSSSKNIDTVEDKWMDRAAAESQQKAVNLEIFVASGRFLDELIRFVRSQPTIHFIVMAAKDGSKFTSALGRLREEFDGEILLVEKAGKVTRVSDLYVQSSLWENSA
ncbi:MAG: universal stress protein [Desulfomonile tiedjei]|uniref:Universal stress protein n=1 Tax=Desulfomonile tiedjei TaxID=2358 RepID=A0A9D6UY76_9BACT|nr:universal stress protein [Desulfomonile tiedjei]